jgi:hypothetical protein
VASFGSFEPSERDTRGSPSDEDATELIVPEWASAEHDARKRLSGEKAMSVAVSE